MDFYLDYAFFTRSADYGVLERGVEEFWDDCQYINSHLQYFIYTANLIKIREMKEKVIFVGVKG